MTMLLSMAANDEARAAELLGCVPMTCPACHAVGLRPLCDLGRVHKYCLDRDLLRHAPGRWKWLDPEPPIGNAGATSV